MTRDLTNTQKEDVLLITLDSCRFDTFKRAHTIFPIGPLHRAESPSYFTYGSHAAIWMSFTRGQYIDNLGSTQSGKITENGKRGLWGKSRGWDSTQRT